MVLMVMVSLDSVLKQREDISKYLEVLVEAHKKALSNETVSGQLDSIRDHISICFDDLCTINDMLISHDGIVRKEIANLQDIRGKILELSRAETELLQQKRSWQLKNNIEADDILIQDSMKLSIETNYRNYMNKYIELVGISHTSLVNRDDTTPESTDDKIESEENDNDMNREDIIKSMDYLKNAHNFIQKDIKLLENLLRDFKKDSTFLENEIKAQTGKIRNKRIQINNKLEEIETTRNNFLSQIGLKLPQNHSSTITERFLNIFIHEESIEKLTKIADDKLIFIIEFVDLKLESLIEQLKSYKNESSKLTSQKAIWSDCINIVVTLEKNLKYEISSSTKNLIKAEHIINTIQHSIAHLDNLCKSTNEKIISDLMAEEEGTLIRACQELKGNKRVDPISTRSKAISVTSNNNIQPKMPIYSNSTFLTVGKSSPPKIGITQENISSNEGVKSDSKKRD